MTRYRKTMAEAWNDSILIESGLMGTIKPDQLDNIKKVWAKKSMKDVTPGVKAMLAKLDMPTKVAVKHANINVLSKLVLDEKDPDEGVELDEGRMKDIFTADQEGKSAEEIAKRLKISVSTVKSILGIKEELDESAAAREIARTNTKKDSMDYGMYNKSVDLLKSKKYDELKKFLKKSDTAPREYVMSTIAKKEPATFKKMYGDQTGYYSLMNQKEDYNAISQIDEVANFTATMLSTLKKEFEPLKGKSISAARARQLMNILDKLNDANLETLSKHKIPFVSGGARAKLNVRRLSKKGVKISTMSYGGSGFYKEEGAQDIAGVDNDNRAPIEERFTIQITKMDGGKLVHGSFKTKAEAEKFLKWYKTGDVRKTKKMEIIPEGFGANTSTRQGSASRNAKKKYRFGYRVQDTTTEKEVKSVDEKIDPFMVSYSDRYGKHAGFEGAKTLQDLQNKAANLRKKGFKIDKMGRYNPPVKEDVQNEACWVGYKQVGMKKKGDRTVPNCVPEDKELEEHIEEMAKDKAYAIGMAAAKKHTGDTEAPLEKSTIKKGHEIADKLLKKEKRIRPARLGESVPKGQKMYGEGAKKLVDRIIKEKMEKKQ
tara:strand:+ start:76 stop:1872 length:1797 start_codon:yes stop_codon:yes gene_type:complete